ncbi:single-pass membrane and coiled-coil domain-containing protein 1 [Discoglossus pictus]
MSKKSVPYSSFKPALCRLEQRLDVVQIQFDNLQKRTEELTRRLDLQAESMVRQTGQDDMWSSLLDNSFSHYDRNLFYSCVVDTLTQLHSMVKEQLPEQVRAVPTLAAVLKSRSHKIRQALYEALRTLGLSEEEMKTLCTFFITYCNEAQYLPPEKRQPCAINDIIGYVIKDQMLKQSLKSAVLAMERSKASKTQGLVSDGKS